MTTQIDRPQSEASLSRSLLAILSAELGRIEQSASPESLDDVALFLRSIKAARACLDTALLAAAQEGLDLERISEAIRRCHAQRLRLETTAELMAIEVTRKTQITRLLEIP
jgi:hypothetical protein